MVKASVAAQPTAQATGALCSRRSGVTAVSDQLQAVCSEQSTHQVAHDDLGASLHGQVQRGQLGGVLHARVDVGLHADQEQHALDVRVLNGHVQEIPTLVINLRQKGQ